MNVLGHDNSARLQQLEQLWSAWLDQEPDEESIEVQYKWHQDGLKILRELLTLKPEDADLRMRLALTLRWLGQEEKVRMDNRNRARILLEEALELRPNDALIHYHLGWLSSMKRNSDQAILHFEKALASSSLELHLRIRAACNLAKLYILQGDSTRATNCVEEARNTLTRIHKDEVRRECLTHIQMAEMDLDTLGHMYPYTLQRPGKKIKRLTRKEGTTLKEQTSTDTLTLCLLENQTMLIGSAGAKDIGEMRAALCERLLMARRTLSRKELHVMIWPLESINAVSSTMERLRADLFACLGIEGSKVIFTERFGYRWNPEIPWQILRDANEPI